MSRPHRAAITYREPAWSVEFGAEYGVDRTFVYAREPRVSGVVDLTHAKLRLVEERILRAQELLGEPTE